MHAWKSWLAFHNDTVQGSHIAAPMDRDYGDITQGPHASGLATAPSEDDIDEGEDEPQDLVHNNYGTPSSQVWDLLIASA